MNLLNLGKALFEVGFLIEEGVEICQSFKSCQEIIQWRNYVDKAIRLAEQGISIEGSRAIYRALKDRIDILQKELWQLPYRIWCFEKERWDSTYIRNEQEELEKEINALQIDIEKYDI